MMVAVYYILHFLGYSGIMDGMPGGHTATDMMQKVGMTNEDIRNSVNSQMLTVFLIPIIFACIHLAVVLPIVNKLLMLFGLFDVPRLIITSAVCVLICGIVYAVIYRLTSNAYYRIVS